MTLEEFIKKSLESNTTKNTYELDITEESCNIIKKHTNLNIHKYKFIIQEEYIRHIKNRHPEDMFLLPQLPTILNNFSSDEKSLTKNSQTKQTEVSLVFRKKLNDGTVKMVAIRLLRNKILSLKTFFRPD